MNTKILMPALSPTMTEGNLTKWLVKVGQKVKAGDIIAEIETDKATMEVEAVDEGNVEKLLFSIKNTIFIENNSFPTHLHVCLGRSRDFARNKNNIIFCRA